MKRRHAATFGGAGAPLTARGLAVVGVVSGRDGGVAGGAADDDAAGRRKGDLAPGIGAGPVVMV